MPLAIDPNETFEVVLKSDQDKPMPEQARFKFRYMTAREFVRTAAVGDISKEEAESLGTAAVAQKLFTAIRVNLVACLAIQTAAQADDELEDVLTISEAWELYYSVRRQSKISVTEKNDSASPSSSSGDDFAKAAPGEASASIPSTNAAPPSSNAPAAEAQAATPANPATSG